MIFLRGAVSDRYSLFQRPVAATLNQALSHRSVPLAPTTVPAVVISIAGKGAHGVFSEMKMSEIKVAQLPGLWRSHDLHSFVWQCVFECQVDVAEINFSVNRLSRLVLHRLSRL
jgi:hypothetical protein